MSYLRIYKEKINFWRVSQIYPWFIHGILWGLYEHCIKYSFNSFVFRSVAPLLLFGVSKNETFFSFARFYHLWFYDSIWLYDSLILRFYDSTILWFYDSTIQWFYDSTILRFNDSMILWFYDSMVYDSTILRFYDFMIFLLTVRKFQQHQFNSRRLHTNRGNNICLIKRPNGNSKCWPQRQRVWPKWWRHRSDNQSEARK